MSQAALSAVPAMPASPSSSTPEPVGAMRFTVDIPGVPIGRFSECGGIGFEYQTMEYHEGGQNAFVHRLRGPIRYRNLILKRGVTTEDGLQRWFQRSQHLKDRPTLTVSLLAPDGQPLRRWAFERAFPVRWTGPSLNAGANTLATEELEIAHRGLLVAVQP